MLLGQEASFQANQSESSEVEHYTPPGFLFCREASSMLIVRKADFTAKQQEAGFRYRREV